MLTWAIVISVLVLLALLRFGVIVEYSEAGFDLWAKIGFVKLKLMGEGVEKKPKKKKEKKPKEKKETNLKDMMPGSLSEFMTILRSVGNMLNRLKRRLLIRKLVLHFTSAGDNPANTAIMFGAANAGFNTIIPALERNFRIKHRDLRSGFDFEAKEQKIYANIAISIAVWEVFYIIFALFPILRVLFKSRKRAKKVPDDKNIDLDRKDGQDDGQTPKQ